MEEIDRKKILEKQLQLLSEASEKNKEKASMLVMLTRAIVEAVHELAFCGNGS